MLNYPQKYEVLFKICIEFYINNFLWNGTKKIYTKFAIINII